MAWPRRKAKPHRLRAAQPPGLGRTVDMVDLRTSKVHLLTPDAAAADLKVALCGADVIPASLTEPGRGYCQSCRSQRKR